MSKLLNSTKSCTQTKFVHSSCDGCGVRPEILHKPTGRRGPRYCENCCPVCGPEATVRANYRSARVSIDHIDEIVLADLAREGRLWPESTTEMERLLRLAQDGYVEMQLGSSQIGSESAFVLTALGQSIVEANKRAAVEKPGEV